ncbi:hypothetical protein ACJJTC_017199 [Scirpophaga incertulas]
MKRRNQQSDISSFFKKAAISEPEPGTSHSASSSDFIAESPSTASGKAIDLEHDSDSDSNKCDIYNYVHNLDPQLDNVSKLNMLENIWKPPNNFNFPLHEHGGHKRRLIIRFVQHISFQSIVTSFRQQYHCTIRGKVRSVLALNEGVACGGARGGRGCLGAITQGVEHAQDEATRPPKSPFYVTCNRRSCLQISFINPTSTTHRI